MQGYLHENPYPHKRFSLKIMQGDILEWRWDGETHVYSFDKDFLPLVRIATLSQLARAKDSGKLRAFATSHNTRDWSAVFNEHVEEGMIFDKSSPPVTAELIKSVNDLLSRLSLFTRIPARLSMSRQQHTIYIYYVHYGTQEQNITCPESFLDL